MRTIKIRDNEGNWLDCKVEVGDGEIIVHSRSGAGETARNPDYRAAVEAILTRLAASGTKPDVYLDSRPVAHLPLDQRLVARGSQLRGTIGEQFNFLVRSMNEGSDSHSAWRRILLKIPSDRVHFLSETIRGTFSPPAANDHKRRIELLRRPGPVERLTAEQQNRVKPEHVRRAVALLLVGEIASNFADSRDYDLLAEGKRLPPKKAFGRALEEAGVVNEAFPGHFSAGWSQPCFRILQEAGYPIVDKTSPRQAVTAEQARTALAALPADQEEQRWAEGDVRIVKHLKRERKRDSKVAQAKRDEVRGANGGRLVCERCPTDWYAAYPEGVVEAIFEVHHTIPLAEMEDGHETALEDLLCLCANCHRAEHRQMALGT